MHRNLLIAAIVAPLFGLAPAAFAQSNNGGEAAPQPGAQANVNTGGQMNKMSANVETSSTQVRLSQVLLSSMGLYHGAIDGMDGQETSRAIQAFQSREQLRNTGKLDQQTRSAMDRLAADSLMGQGGNAMQGQVGENGANPSGSATPKEGRAAAVGGNGGMGQNAVTKNQGDAGGNGNSSSNSK